MMIKIYNVWIKIVSFLSPLFNKVYSSVPDRYLSSIKNIFALIGLFSVFYFVIFFSISRPKHIEESENKINVFKNVIKDNNKEIKQLQNENDKIENYVVNLEKDLLELQDKSEKYRKRYEKQVRDIGKLNNNELSRQFAITFEDLY